MYLLHLESGNRMFSRAEIIENARKQESAGILPRYKYNDGITPAG